MRLLLINPKYPESFWSFKWAIDGILPSKRAINPPLGLATLAALCPPTWNVEIVDENIESIPLAPDVDLIGVCGMGVQFARQSELLRYYRERHYPVVAGGSFASLCPERYAALADTVVAGEAEYTWPRFCADFEAGHAGPMYRETGVVALTDSPTPRFDLLKLDRYSTATVQFSRGCPYRCEFCDIIVMFGRKPRTKPLAQVERELDALRALGVRNVFFVDDNLIGNRAVAKELLRRLIDYQARHRYRFRFGTEASINLAQDVELMQLMRDANFGWVFIGIESSDPQTLKDTRKTQNTQQDMLQSVRTIYGFGIDVLGGFIVGFDNDTLESFETQYRFIMDSGIQAAMVGLLTALPRTPLYERLEREGRLRGNLDLADNTKLATNVVPKRITYDQLIDAYKRLYRRLLEDRAIAERIRNKLRHLGRPVYDGEYPALQRIAIVLRLLAKGIAPGGPRRIHQFLRSIPWRAPRKLPLAIVDWIAGLSMRDYVQRHFEHAQQRPHALLDRRLAAMRKLVATQIRLGRVSLAARAARIELTLSLEALTGRRFFLRLGRHLDRLLSFQGATLRLNIDSLPAQEAFDVERLLARLAHHGDRVFVMLNQRLQQLVRVDSSRFNLVLVPDRA
ncbi:MAG: B12-binding domain-containing radical SAM protein [Betaproteobacteria bacterium]|nr:B12-binding domain-containing radical SAM protein [Betaproteobacteria bacterium]